MNPRDKQYGTILAHFINAPNVEAACSEYFENLERVFNFSPGFAKQMKDVFPSLARYGHFDDAAKEELQKLHIKRIRQQEVVEHFLSAINNTEFFGFDGENKKLSIAYRNQFHELIGPCWVSLEELEQLFLRELRCHTSDSLHEPCEKLLEIGHRIWELENSIEEDFASTISIRAVAIENILTIYEAIAEARSIIRSVFEALSAGKPLSKDAGDLWVVLTRYDKIRNPRKVTITNARIEDLPLFHEDDYLYCTDSHPPNPEDTWENLIGDHLAYFTVNFLRDPKNAQLIGKCEECKSFFIKSKNQVQRFCSTKCRLALHNREDIASGKRASQKRERHGWQPRERGKR